MANLNVRLRLARLAADAAKIEKHAALYSGVSAAQSAEIDNLCSEAIQSLAHIAELARIAGGNISGRSLQRRIRKALGFTYP